MALQSVNTEISDSLTDLEDADFDRFCFHLRDSSVKPRIRAGEVERKSRIEITKLLVSRCAESGALRRTIDTLRAIGCNNEAQGLESRTVSRLAVSSQMQMKEPLSEDGPRDPEVPAEPLRVRTNGATPAKPTQSVVKDSLKSKTGESGERLLFGKHIAKSFEWLLQNDADYAAYVVATHLKEREEGNMAQNKLMKNKDALAEYVRRFPNVTEEVRFYREGLAPVGFGKYKDVTRRDLYNSKDEKKKRYVKWLRSLEGRGGGVQLDALLKYISHRDRKTCPSSSFTLPPQEKFTAAVKKPWL